MRLYKIIKGIMLIIGLLLILFFGTLAFFIGAIVFGCIIGYNKAMEKYGNWAEMTLPCKCASGKPKWQCCGAKK